MKEEKKVLMLVTLLSVTIYIYIKKDMIHLILYGKKGEFYYQFKKI